MRFIQEADEIPIDLLNAQENNELVIFVGAGVSMNLPSRLPSFNQLAKKITYNAKLEKNENIDGFLGRISDEYPNEPFLLHKRTIDYFKKYTQYNNLHKNILKLFKNDIRIVTTNFDNLLNIAAKDIKIDVNSYYAPALPLGDNFEGIVYLHGCIDDKPENLVLTDKDFSQAYLCRGWASEFIKRLFDKYCVLFIGYSYNDSILNYLTRGLIPKRAYAIISEEEQNKWNGLRINTITYENKNNKHSNLQKLLEHWIAYFLADKLQEKTKIEYIASLFQFSLDEISIGYVLNHIFKEKYRISIFLEKLNDKNKLEWLLYIVENVDLYNEEQYELFETLPKWIINNIIKDELLYKDEKNHKIIDYLRNPKQNDFLNNFRCRLKNCLSEGDINRNILSFWLENLIETTTTEKNDGFLTLILQKCLKNNYELEAKILIRHLLNFNIQGNKYGEKIIYNAHNYYFQEIIQKNLKELINYYDTILQTVEFCFSKISEIYKLRRNKKDDFLFLNYIADDISLIEKPNYNEDNLTSIFYIVKIAFEKIITENPKLATNYINRWLYLDSYILNRFAFYFLKQRQLISFKNVISILKNKSWFSEGLFYYSKEVMDYFKMVYFNLPDNKKESFIKTLISNKKITYHNKYLILNHISNKQVNDNIIKQYKDCLLQQIPAEDRKYIDKRELFTKREFDFGTIKYDCKYNLKEILKDEITPEIIKELKNAEADEVIGQHKFNGKHSAFLEFLYKEIAEEYILGINLLNSLLKYEEFNADLFVSIFRGLSWNINTIKQDKINELLSKIYECQARFDDIDIYEHILYFIENIINRANKNELVISDKIEQIRAILEFVWSVDNTEKEIKNDIFSQAINNMYGRTVMAYIKLCWYDYNENKNNLEIFKQYLKIFSRKIEDKDTFKSKMALSILSSNIFFLYSYDRKWTKQALISQLDVKNSNKSIVWNSILYANPRFSEDIIKVLLPYFNKLIFEKDFNILNDNLMDAFCRFYSHMYLYSMIYSKKLLSKFKLDNLFRNRNKNNIYNWYRQFLTDIENILQEKKFDIEALLYDFFKMRMEKASDIEQERLLFILLMLENYLKNCLDIIKKINIKSFDIYILHKIKQIEFEKKHPIETIQLLNYMINRNTYSCLANDFDLREIITTLKELQPNNKTLMELLGKVVTIDGTFEWAYKLMQERGKIL